MRHKWIYLLSSAFLLTVPLWCQEVSAGLTGRVTDPTGAVVIGATVTLVDLDRSTPWPATTNEDGIYAYPRIPNGSYRVTVEAAISKTSTIENSNGDRHSSMSSTPRRAPCPMPFGRGRAIGTHWIRPLDMTLGGWQLTGTFTLRGSFPMTPTVSTDLSGTGSRGMRANVIGMPRDQHRTGPGQPFLDGSAYAVPGPRTFGTSGIGVVRGPGMHHTDVSLNKDFRIAERKTFPLRAAAYNLTNTPIMGAPYTMVITSP